MHFNCTATEQQEHTRAVTPTGRSDIGQWLGAFGGAGGSRAAQWIHRVARNHPAANVEQLLTLVRRDMLHRPQDVDTRTLLEILHAPTKDFLDYVALVLEFV